MKGNTSMVDDPQLITRIKQHCRNYPRKTKFNADDVAYDLQQKFHEYDSKKFPFLHFRSSVQDALTMLNLTDAPPDIIDTEISVVSETKRENKKENARKRKAENKQSATVDIIVSSDEEQGRTFEAHKTNNRANKTVTNLYSANKLKTPTTDSRSKSHGKNQKPTGDEKSEKKPRLPTRGLGNVSSLNILPKESRIKFKDLGGCERQFLEVCKLATHMKKPKTYESLGIRDPPKGFILHGPPGSGKTLFAQAIAGEFDLPLIHLAATHLISGVTGETEEKIRQLFETAKTHAPCIVIIDDIDSIAPRRETAQREMDRRLVNQLCNSLDELNTPPKEKPLAEQLKFESNGDISMEEPQRQDGYVFVIGTTSRPESLDSSLRRAGRFEKDISLGIPDEQARFKILATICKLPLDDSVNFLTLARLTPGYVGADLNALIQEAGKCGINRIFDNLVQRSSKKKRMTNEEIIEELSKVLIWLNSDDDPSAIEGLGGFKITLTDFERALESVQPSAKREGFATVPDTSWDDIGALSLVRRELEWNILYPIKRPEDFALLGISTKPQGILLCGPPGCGKTLLAKAVANESGMNFISVKGPELLNMYVGESERAVRTVFQRARDSCPCVIFFDEIDALCPKRSNNESTGGARLVNQLLTEMDGIEERKQVFLIGATNRPDIVDPAILRPGRLDKILFVDVPTAADRVDILLKATKNGTHPRLASDVDFQKIAQMPEIDGFTGADLAAVVHEAAIIALKERIADNNLSITAVGLEHFEKAVKKIRPSVNEADRRKYEKMKEAYASKPTAA